MDVQRMIDEARDAMTVKRVYGEPFEKDGVTIITAAKVSGGGGGGGGGDQAGNQGSGGGFGLSASPVGAFVIKGGQVTWQPVVDVNRAILGGQIVAIMLLLTIRMIVKTRAGQNR